MQGITPFLWFNGNAEEAVNFYVSTFPNSMIETVTRYNKQSAEASGRPEGSVMTMAFRLDGQEFVALNGGPQFTFSPAISFVANCDNQEEIDALWERLSERGEKWQCGWLKDRFGVTWQIVPAGMGQFFKEGEVKRGARVMDAMMKMEKIDLVALQKAYQG